VSKPKARNPMVSTSGYETSIPRVVVAVLLVVVGIAWMAVYTNLAMDAANFKPIEGVDIAKPDNPLPWMASLGRWNYLIGFGLIFLGLIVASHRTTPLGRGRGVVVGMLGCFLLGLLWIVVFYFVGQEADFNLPVMDQLDQSNLFVGIGFMAVGFTYATKWE
jgi:hypothetical protein